jgi:YidC/Oxa1 family membrane protein insertase
MEERRLLLAVALSFLVLTGYQLLFAPAPRPSPPPPAPTPLSPSGAGPAPVTPPPPAPSPSAIRIADQEARRVDVVGKDVELAFTNRGARLYGWRLTRFRDRDGQPEDLVPAAAKATAAPVAPLDVETGDAALDARLREALFKPSTEATTVTAPAELTFAYADGEVEAEKKVHLGESGYLLDVAVSVRRQGQELSKRLVWGPGLGNPTTAETEVQGYQPPQVVLLSPAGVERVLTDRIGNVRSLPGIRWIGIETQYFAALWVARGQGTGELRTVELAPAADGQKRQGAQASLDLGSSTEPALLYAGPKDYHALSRLGHDLARVVPVGDWIGWIVVPLLSLLRLLHGLTTSYGFSIILLTVLINAAMAPLRHYSIANGLRMAKIAPEMRAIQERYKKMPMLDPRRQEMQKEMAALYARHGMSMGTQMAVGCLPLLLTMPFLFAIYRVLQVSIDLRGASFLWVPDLSHKDPVYVTPILMGVSMLVMQRLTPTAMDPKQQRIMLIMPLVLMVMFINMPAGLNLYWLASNLCSIAQQMITIRVMRGREAAEAARRGKKRR